MSVVDAGTGLQEINEKQRSLIAYMQLKLNAYNITQERMNEKMKIKTMMPNLASEIYYEML